MSTIYDGWRARPAREEQTLGKEGQRAAALRHHFSHNMVGLCHADDMHSLILPRPLDRETAASPPTWFHIARNVTNLTLPSRLLPRRDDAPLSTWPAQVRSMYRACVHLLIAVANVPLSITM